MFLCGRVAALVADLGRERLPHEHLRHLGVRRLDESLVGVERGALHLAVVKDDAFRLPVLQEKFAVVGAMQRVVDDPLDAAAIQAGANEKQLVGGGEIGHKTFLCPFRALPLSQQPQ